LAADQTPIALGRSASPNNTEIVASDMTMTPAPAAPTTIRAAVNAAADGANAQAAEPRANSPSDPTSTVRRP
jgi:hypothetical protein